jgi:hypothetical protein
VQTALLPAAWQAPVHALTWKPSSGKAVQVLLPPSSTISGSQATVPLPSDVAVTEYVGIASKATVEVLFPVILSSWQVVLVPAADSS